MNIQTGERLGPYEILAPLGAGGMGEVFKAKDARLDRLVAVKVLPEHLAQSPDALARFEREAKAVAALNHPNILGIHDFATQDGIVYVVMELLEGESLRTRLEQGPLPPRQATELAVQLAQGLAAAHEKGVVHRDLKPDNLWITREGRLKILDFGLAKVVAPMGQGSDPLMPTESFLPGHQTERGMILGTLGYMSPEQVRGEAVDGRSDLFSFGAVLFEMLTGRRAFARASASDTLAAILRDEPPEAGGASRPIPPALRRVIDHCLEKAPAQRFRDAQDLAFALESTASPASSESFLAPFAPQHRRTTGRWAALAGAAFLGVAALLAVAWNRPAPPMPALETQLVLPRGFQLRGSLALVLSPDGRNLLVVGAEEALKPPRLFIRPMDDPALRPLAGTEGAAYPFWSPDGSELAFFADGKLKRVPLAGGAPQTLCEANDGRGGSWGADNLIVFTPALDAPLYKVSAFGGTPVAITTKATAVESHRNPHFLPDGRRLLFNAYQTFNLKGFQGASLLGLDVATGKVTPILKDVGEGYGVDGSLVFLRGAEILEQPMDFRTFRLSGQPRPLVAAVENLPARLLGAFTIARGGLMIHLPLLTPTKRQLTWFDTEGRSLGTVGEPMLIAPMSLRLSPDGHRLAFARNEAPGISDLWSLDLARGVPTRLTFGGDVVVDYQWSPDGRTLYFGSTRGLVAQDAAMPRQERVVTERRAYPGPVTPDGTRIITRYQDSVTRFDLHVLSVQGGEDRPLIATPANEADPALSPDGHWLAYTSDESGTQEVFLLTFPGLAGRVQVSNGGGAYPMWIGRTGLLAFRKGDAFRAVQVSGRGDALQVGEPRPFLAQLPREIANQMVNTSGLQIPLMVPDADGRRLLLALAPLDTGGQTVLRVSTAWGARKAAR